MAVVGPYISGVIDLYILVLIVRLVFEYVQLFSRTWRPRGVVLVVAELVYTLTDPPLRALRRIIPPLRFGGVAIDLSYLVLILGLQILSGIFNNL